MRTCERLTLAVCASMILALGCGGDSGGGSAAGGSGSGGSGAGGKGAGGSGAGGSGAGGNGAAGQSGTPGGLSTGLDKSKTVGDLSDADAQKFCMAADSFVKNNANVGSDLCKILSLVAVAFGDPKSDAEAQMLCQMGINDCKSSTSTSMCGQIPKACKATIGDVEACWSASVAYLDSLAAQIPACDKLTLKDLQPSSGGGQTPVKPAACAPLETDECSSLDLGGVAE